MLSCKKQNKTVSQIFILQFAKNIFEDVSNVDIFVTSINNCDPKKQNE